MRADRLLSILLYLHSGRRWTAGELARRLEVCERTIYRDMDALSTAGIPVMAERGARGGWHLPDGYRTDIPGLTDSEIQALFLSRPSRLLADLGLYRAAELALDKLFAALPSVSRLDAAYARQRIHVDSTGWRSAADDVSALPTLQEAIWQERKLHFSYRRSDGQIMERLVDPLGLVAKGSVWYLVASVDGEARTYRVSRIQHATLTPDRSERPADFDLASYWERSSAEFQSNLPRYPATLRVRSDALPRLRQIWRYARIDTVGPPDSEGWHVLGVQFEVEDEACAYVLSLGPAVEVLEPTELRQKVIALAEATSRLYTSGASSVQRVARHAQAVGRTRTVSHDLVGVAQTLPVQEELV